jgi:hypothetical protein
MGRQRPYILGRDVEGRCLAGFDRARPHNWLARS